MDERRSDLDRRAFLKHLLAAGVVGSAGAAVLVRHVLAMGQAGQLLEVIRKAQCELLVNGAPAQVGSLVFPGDVISTGSTGLGVFVVGKDAFLVRENSRIELGGEKAGQEPGATKIVHSLKVAVGKVLSVFGSGGKRIETLTAIAGTRGTGVYIESDPEMTYFCLCYGATDLSSSAKPDVRESFSADYHEARYVLHPSAGRVFLRAPKINHADEELIMLEALVGRKVPFAGKSRNTSTMFY